ncbi:MAG: phage late control D family protein [Candidatus Entotheonellia bacterium]
MTVVTLDEESAGQGDFYVPQFEVRIEGVGLPPEVLRDVIQITYKDSIKEIDSFGITVNNWDPTTRDFKYVGAETKDTLETNPLHRLFDPCHKKFEVRMGYLSPLRLMMRGSFTTLEPNFPSGGGPTLEVRGLNVLHELRSKQYSSPWKGKTDSQIAEEIATLMDPGPPPKKRFPLSIVTDEKAKSQEKPLVYVAQNNQYDIDFLWSRAKQRGYVVCVLEADPAGRRPRRPQRLYFGPSQGGQMEGLRDVTFELKWGISLMDFKPTLTTANQIKAATVKGVNRATRQAIKAKVTLRDRRIDINRDLLSLLEECHPREEIVVNEPSFTPAQAQERALAILLERFKEMVTASGTCVGLPDMRAGQWVKIAGVGSRFSGTYFVTETTHTINDQGYITKFNARREDRGI